MCEIMNKSLSSVYTVEEDFIEPDIVTQALKIEGIKVEKGEVLKILKKVDPNKAMGPDGVSGWILKECAEEIVDPIHNLIQCSLNTGELPCEWKRANIVPIYKGGDSENALNYRPVSLISLVAKICENIIRTKWIVHLERNKLITPRQFGFREGTSCVTNLLSFYSRVIDIVQEREGWADCVYLDLKKSIRQGPTQ